MTNLPRNIVFTLALAAIVPVTAYARQSRQVLPTPLCGGQKIEEEEQDRPDIEHGEGAEPGGDYELPRNRVAYIPLLREVRGALAPYANSLPQTSSVKVLLNRLITTLPKRAELSAEEISAAASEIQRNPQIRDDLRAVVCRAATIAFAVPNRNQRTHRAVHLLEDLVQTPEAFPPDRIQIHDSQLQLSGVTFGRLPIKRYEVEKRFWASLLDRLYEFRADSVDSRFAYLTLGSPWMYQLESAYGGRGAAVLVDPRSRAMMSAAIQALTTEQRASLGAFAARAPKLYPSAAIYVKEVLTPAMSDNPNARPIDYWYPAD